MEITILLSLSGEIADQAVLDGLAPAFPHASIGHAYASTEAGVGFAVDDGREGFPAADLIGPNGDGVEMNVVDGSLRIRSHRTARAYISTDAPQLTDAEGFVDTGDLVELRNDVEAILDAHCLGRDVRLAEAASS